MNCPERTATIAASYLMNFLWLSSRTSERSFTSESRRANAFTIFRPYGRRSEFRLWCAPSNHR